jgi:hypothetical protein
MDTKLSEKQKPARDHPLTPYSVKLSLNIELGNSNTEKDKIIFLQPSSLISSLACDSNDQAFSKNRRQYTSEDMNCAWRLMKRDQCEYSAESNPAFHASRGPTSDITFLVKDLINILQNFNEEIEESEEPDDCISVDSIDLAKKRMKRPFHKI